MTPHLCWARRLGLLPFEEYHGGESFPTGLYLDAQDTLSKELSVDASGWIVAAVRAMQMRGSAPLKLSICRSGSLHDQG